MTDTNHNSLKAVLSELIERITTEGWQNRAKLISIIIENSYIAASIEDLEKNRFEEFHEKIVRKSEDLIEGIVEHVFGEARENSDISFLIKQYDFVYHHLEQLFTKFEGHACCVDKTRTVLARLLLNKACGARIEFDYNGEWTYHIPKKILTSHDAVIEFFDAMINLYYGRHEKYLAMLIALSGRSKS
ncbi:hypothetical protein [Mesorhizobium sp. SP-1A]|uniref:hypothetical protein n=1 Tax=Mesorhizobium sp. SP-1A TaxID=3077840 RepID=UPI0028F74417|nr:hypothetical protein [Mesorhizobium sp. SP-1A]